MDVAELIEVRTGVRYSLSGAHRLMKTLDLGYQKTRPSHPRADPTAPARIKKALPGKLKEIAQDHAQGGQV